MSYTGNGEAQGFYVMKDVVKIFERSLLAPDAASVHPKVSQAITSRLFCTEPDLSITSLALPGTVHQVFQGDLFSSIYSPIMRQYGVWWDVIAEQVLSQSKLVITGAGAF